MVAGRARSGGGATPQEGAGATVNVFATSEAFRRSVEDRLKQQAIAEQVDPQRLRRALAFDRFLARIFANNDPPWLLKGGYSLELRLHKAARSTKDIDLIIPAPGRAIRESDNQLLAIREMLQDAVERDLGDWFNFRISAPKEDITAEPYGGGRFTVTALIANKTFDTFPLDISLGEALVSDPDWIEGITFLEFVNIPPARVAALPIDQHFAEKVHVYTFPREGSINSRVKDLVDLVLLIEAGLSKKDKVVQAIRATFERRNTHPVPARLNAPPDEWKTQYEALAADCGVGKATIEEAYEFVSAFWNTLDIS